ncbi:uracil-DNA glycosylase [Candidatus Gracilibacteria bacterium]|nr:uracil-DNA glycosylase [Candidatus Gracilibacteria bacterium]
MKLEDQIKSCKNCNLYKTCKLPVAGDGNFKTKILFIGEAPGKEEDEQNKPFVGRSGKLLTKILENLGYFREKDYYITNIVKCRPPNNRDPNETEIKTCSPYLIRQIEEMKPKLIVTLGRFSFNFLVPNISITNGRGKAFQIHGILGQKLDFSPIVFAIYHPAVALYNPSKIETIKEDLGKIKTILKQK